jgi:hypothetical protein
MSAVIYARERKSPSWQANIVALQQKCVFCPKKKKVIQRSSLSPVELDSSIVHDVITSTGQPLGVSTRSFFESKFGYDFGKVRVHTDARAAESARKLNARAYATGQNIVFGSGEYDAETREGKRLLGHELAHVVQQSRRLISPQSILDRPGDGLERAADEAADGIFFRNVYHEKIAPAIAASPATLIQRQIGTPADPKIQGMFTILIEPESGRAEFRASGPEDTPVVSSPTIGIRRDARRQYHLLFGGKDKVISISEIPSLLRSTVSGSSSGGPSMRIGFRLPACQEMIGSESGEYMSYEEFKVSRSLSNEMIQISRPFYEACIEICKQQSAPKTQPEEEQVLPGEPSEPGDFPERLLPEGTEYA